MENLHHDVRLQQLTDHHQMCFRLQVYWKHGVSLLRTRQLKKTLDGQNSFYHLPKITSTTAADGAVVHLSLRGTQGNTHKKVFMSMTDCSQIWICGSITGFICHLKDPFNAALDSDETQILITKYVETEDFAELPSGHRCHRKRRRVKWVKRK